MLKKLVLGLIFTFSVSAVSMAQWNFDKAKAEKVLTPITDWMASGSGALTYVSAKAPSTFGFRIGLMAAASSVPEIEGSNDAPGFAVNNAALVASLGTMGFEATLKLLPAGDFTSTTVGLKYELTSLIPLPPGIPISIAGYADYNKSTIKIDQTELGASNVGFGGLISGDLVIIKAYGRLGYEIGSGSLKYTYDAVADGYPAGTPGYEVDLSPDSNGLRAAVGGSLGFFDVEVGYRSYAYYAVGLSVGF